MAELNRFLLRAVFSGGIMNYVTKDSDIQKSLLDRFIKYVKIWTESSSQKADEGMIPSEQREFDLAKQLSAELTVMGLQKV